MPNAEKSAGREGVYPLPPRPLLLPRNSSDAETSPPLGRRDQAFSAASTSSSIFFASPNSMRLFSL
jgi:hypothetical protein